MKLVEYKELALRSMKPHESKNLAVCDWCLGLTGESAEVIECFTDALLKYGQGELWSPDERVNFAKEIGDVLWYTVALCNEVDLELDDTISFSELDKTATPKNHAEISGLHECLKLPILTGGVAEVAKHGIVHQEGLDTEKIKRFIPEIWKYLHLLSCSQGFTLADAAELNVAKLAHRYNIDKGGAYSNEKSANRHAQEEKFTDTEKYQQLRARILGGVEK